MSKVEQRYYQSLSLKSKIIVFVEKLFGKTFDIDRLYTIYNGKLMHREHLALYPYCRGKGIDVGCGGNKIHPDAIGIDIVPKGKKGLFGSQRGIVSKANIHASGDDLSMFKDGELDYVVSVHTLEHFQYSAKTLIEWKRVLKPGGILGVVLPDDSKIDTIKLDPTHKSVFTQQSFENLVNTIGGFEIIKIRECIKDWSFLCVMKKK